jgi:hypothetical protein
MPPFSPISPTFARIRARFQIPLEISSKDVIPLPRHRTPVPTRFAAYQAPVEAWPCELAYTTRQVVRTRAAIQPTDAEKLRLLVESVRIRLA